MIILKEETLKTCKLRILKCQQKINRPKPGGGSGITEEGKYARESPENRPGFASQGENRQTRKIAEHPVK